MKVRRGSVGPLGVAMLVLTGAAPAVAADRFVAMAGSDTGTCTAAAAPCRTVAYAVGQAASGDTVKVAAGTYDEHVEMESSTTLTVSGGWSPDFAVHDPGMNPTHVRGAGSPAVPLLAFSDVFFV